MQFVKIQKQEKVNKELANEQMSFTSTLKSLEELGYDYVKDLGVGNFGKVVEMIDPSTKTTCAIKLVKEENISEGELYVWPSVCHSNILPLIGFNYIAEHHTFIFISKKCPFTLDQKLGEVEFIFDSNAFDRAVSWIKDVVRGIVALHEKQMAHLDIKTNNVLISGEDKALVSDFGSMSSTEKKSSAYTSPLPYRPPETYGPDGSWEQVDGIKYNSWTIGMLCIRVFTRENFCETIQQNEKFWPNKMYPLLFDILQKRSFAAKMKTCFPRSQNASLKAEDILSLIRACLQLDPQKRITVKEALNHRVFGGEVFYELEENSPWNKKADGEQIERLIYECKVCQRNIEEYHKGDSVKEEKVDAKENMMANIKIDLAVKVPDSTPKVRNCEKSERDEEKALCDDFVKNTEFRHLEHENPEKSNKIDKRMPVEVVISAHTLLQDVKSQGEFGKYLKEIDSVQKQVPKMKRTNAIVDWARDKKNNFSKIFARYRSTK